MAVLRAQFLDEDGDDAMQISACSLAAAASPALAPATWTVAKDT